MIADWGDTDDGQLGAALGRTGAGALADKPGLNHECDPSGDNGPAVAASMTTLAVIDTPTVEGAKGRAGAR